MLRGFTRWIQKDQWLLLAGIVGLSSVLIASCSGDDGSSSNSTSSSSGSSTGGEGGSGGSGGNGGSGGSASCVNDPATAANTQAVVTAVNALTAALTDTQKTTIQYDVTLANAQQWSNLPTTFVKRNGVRIGDMSTAAQDAAIAVAEAAAGTTGAKLFTDLRDADQWLVSDGKASSTDYGDGLYYFSIHGTPSTSTPWMLQIAGHHLAYNFLYNGPCTSATPLFAGSEPMNWTDTNGTARAPLATQHDAMVALVQSISSSADAKLTGSFGDLINGPGGGGPGGGGGDTKYPASLTYPTGSTGRGVSVATLSAEQKQLVKTAMEAWVKNVADPVSTVLLGIYESDEALAQTYVGFTGASDLSTQGSYVRIDGPRVWIEATVQGGIVYKNVVHWHTIWRDKVADYGAEFAQ